MDSLRTHDVVLAEGTFRIAITPKRRVVAVLDAPTTSLGPLHIVLGIDRAPFLPRGVSPLALEQPATVETGADEHSRHQHHGGFGHVIAHASEGAFNAAAKVATTVARPAFHVVKSATGEGAHLLAHTIPFLPEKERRQMDAAARTILRAKLGDITARRFIKGIAHAAKAGAYDARHIGNTLLDASKVVSHIAELPLVPLEHVPGVGPIVRSVSPFQTWNHMATAIQHGDFKRLAEIARQELSAVQGVVSLIPGVGSGISSAISAGVAALQGGSPIEIAIHATYGAIPIPPGVRQVTDTVLDVVLRLALHGAPLTDVAIHAARDQVPAGIPRDVFDTLIHLVGHHRAIIRAPGALLDHFVRQYAPAGAGLDLPGALVNATHHLPSISLHPHAPVEHHGYTPVPPRGHEPAAPHAHELTPPLALPPGPRMVQPLHLAHA
jgi:hypothetical protein